MGFFNNVLGKKKQTISEIDNIEKTLTVEENDEGKIETVDLQLSLPPDLEGTILNMSRQVMLEELEALPKLKKNDVQINGIYMYDNNQQLEVKLYIRNGVNRPIKLEIIPLAIINSKNEIVVQQVFDLKDIGEIPPLSARPWTVYFSKENVDVDKLNENDWKIIFLFPKS